MNRKVILLVLLSLVPPPHTLHPSHLLDEVATVGHLPSRRLSLSPDPLPRAFTVGGLLYVISRNWDAQGPRSGK